MSKFNRTSSDTWFEDLSTVLLPDTVHQDTGGSNEAA